MAAFGRSEVAPPGDQQYCRSDTAGVASPGFVVPSEETQQSPGNNQQLGPPMKTEVVPPGEHDRLQQTPPSSSADTSFDGTDMSPL